MIPCMLAEAPHAGIAPAVVRGLVGLKRLPARVGPCAADPVKRPTAGAVASRIDKMTGVHAALLFFLF